MEATEVFKQGYLWYVSWTHRTQSAPVPNICWGIASHVKDLFKMCENFVVIYKSTSQHVKSRRTFKNKMQIAQKQNVRLYGVSSFIVHKADDTVIQWLKHLNSDRLMCNLGISVCEYKSLQLDLKNTYNWRSGYCFYFTAGTCFL